MSVLLARGELEGAFTHDRGERRRPRVQVYLFLVVITGINMTSPRTDARGSKGVVLLLLLRSVGMIFRKTGVWEYLQSANFWMRAWH